MKLTINSTLMPFKVDQGSELWQTSFKKKRPEIRDNYSSENYSLPMFYENSDLITIPLVNTFSSITAMETAIHTLFYYATISTGNKSFSCVFENGSLTGSSISFAGVVTDKIVVKYSRNANEFIINIDLKINQVSVI